MTAPIPEDIRAYIIADYEAGMFQFEAAKKYSVGTATVHRIIKEAGAVRGGRSAADVLEAAVADYVDSGESIRVVARRHPVSEDALRAELQARELTRPNGTTTPTRVRTAAIDDFIAGASIATVARRHGIARSTVAAWLADAEVGTEVRDDASPCVYDGGWVLRGGVRYPAKPVRQRVAA